MTWYADVYDFESSYFGIIWFGNKFGYFFHKLADFFQSSGHPDSIKKFRAEGHEYFFPLSLPMW